MPLTPAQKKLSSAVKAAFPEAETLVGVALPKRTPLEQADDMIMRLSMNRPDLAPIHYIGGTKPLTDEEKAENARRHAKYREEYHAIISKYEVEDELIARLRTKLEPLQRQTEAICTEITELEALLAARIARQKT